MRSGKYYAGTKVNGIKRDVHRLVAESAIGRPLLSSEVVHHKDGDINNNDPENLEVMSRGDHARLHLKGKPLSEETKRKLSVKAQGRPNYSCRRFTPRQIRDIFVLHEQGVGVRAIGRKYRVDHTTVLSILKKETYKDVSKEIDK